MNGIEYLLRRLSGATRGERGAVATEYALVLMLIALAIIAAVTLFGVALLHLYEQAPDAFP